MNKQSIAVIGFRDNTYYLRSPFDRTFLDDFKAEIPPAKRRWDGDGKVWNIAPDVVDRVAELCEDRDWRVVRDPSVRSAQTAPTTEVRTVRVYYVGTPKERADGTVSAYGTDGKNWSILFPLDVLKSYFEGPIRMADDDGRDGVRGASNYYGRLGITSSATPDELKKAYRRVARQWHPDVCSEPDATQVFQRIQEAWEVLSDPAKRRKYDVGLFLQGKTDRQTDAFSSPFAADWRPPLRCGDVTLVGRQVLGVFHVERIVTWDDATDEFGRIMVSSWPKGGDTYEIQWVNP